MTILTRELVLEYLEYNKEKGEFTWIKSPARCIKVGDRAGTTNKLGYSTLVLKGSFICVHRLVWFMEYGVFPSKNLDHIDRNPRNNTITNLREADQSQNNCNTVMRDGNTSGYKNITIKKGNKQYARYFAEVAFKGVRKVKSITLNSKRTEEAIIAELTAWTETTRNNLHKEFANHG
jgi:hypothetical protein